MRLVLCNVEDVAFRAAEHYIQEQRGCHVHAHTDQQDPEVVWIFLGVKLRYGRQCTPAILAAVFATCSKVRMNVDRRLLMLGIQKKLT